MNYRHSFHAGNACDVVKHSALVAMLMHFKNKDKPFGVLDTHAGTGLYYLESDQAAKTYEYEQGIKQIWLSEPQHPVLKTYLDVVRSYNSDNILKYYPGSPLIIERFLSEGSHLQCAELHPEDGKDLKQTLRNQSKISVHLQDGYLAPKAFLPFKQKRGFVFVDPPFEREDEFEAMVRAAKEGGQKFAQAVFMLWYPIKDRESVNSFYSALKALNLPNVLIAEFMLYNTQVPNRLNGSGMVIINSPWGMEQTLGEVFKELQPVISFEPKAQGHILSLHNI